jgi:hypothetical protein
MKLKKLAAALLTALALALATPGVASAGTVSPSREWPHPCPHCIQ